MLAENEHPFGSQPEKLWNRWWVIVHKAENRWELSLNRGLSPSLGQWGTGRSNRTDDWGPKLEASILHLAQAIDPLDGEKSLKRDCHAICQEELAVW